MTTRYPDLSGLVEVSDLAIDQFRAEGHTVVRQLATAEEILAYRPLVEELTLQHSNERRPLHEREDAKDRAFIQVTNLWQRDPRVKPLILSRRFAAVAAALLGVDGVRLYHDQSLLKEPGGGPTPWHQDQFYWPIEGAMISAWIPLVEIDDQIGSMTFVPGSHRRGHLGPYAVSDTSDKRFGAMIESEKLPTVTHGVMSLGDATFHTGWTLHRAPPNLTDSPRPVVNVIYFADGARVGSVDGFYRRMDLHDWLPGLTPGDIASTHLNPLLYP